jgi:hypothetical protein
MRRFGFRCSVRREGRLGASTTRTSQHNAARNPNAPRRVTKIGCVCFVAPLERGSHPVLRNASRIHRPIFVTHLAKIVLTRPSYLGILARLLGVQEFLLATVASYAYHQSNINTNPWFYRRMVQHGEFFKSDKKQLACPFELGVGILC